MSSERTGYALGKLDPIYYYEDARGYIIVAPRTDMVRHCYETKNAGGVSLKDRGFEIREADTLPKVTELQKKIQKQEMAKLEAEAQRDERTSAEMWQAIGDRLRQRMISSATTPYERDFIEQWLKLREEKREKHFQRWREHQGYLWALEFDSGTPATARMLAEPGDMWEHGV